MCQSQLIVFILLIYLSNLNNCDNDWITAEPLATNDNESTTPKSIITDLPTEYIETGLKVSQM